MCIFSQPILSVSQTTGLVRSLHVAKKFVDDRAPNRIIDGELLVHRKRIEGLASNRKTKISTPGNPAQVTFNFRRWWPYAPRIIFASLFAWIFVRRNRLKRQWAERDRKRADEFNE